MADKGDKDIGKPSLSSNPFLLPTSPATSQSSKRSHTSYTPSPFGGMPSSTSSTASRNIFSGGSPNISSSTSSRGYSITSLASDAFGASAFKTFDSSSSFSPTVSSKSNVIFGADNTIAKSSTYVHPLFGGEKSEKSGLSDSTSKSSSNFPSALGISPSIVFGAKVGNPSSDSKMIDVPHPKPPVGVPSETLSVPSFQTAVVPTVFGELPGGVGKSSSFIATVSESPSTTSSVFGGMSGTSQIKSEKSADPSVGNTNVFGGTSTGPFPSAFAGQHGSSGAFVTSDSASASTTTLFGGIPDTSVPATSVPDTATTTVFGGIGSEVSPSFTTESGFGTVTVPSDVVGDSEKTPGIITGSSSSHVFGGLPGSSTSGFSSASSSVPRLFSGIPSSGLASGMPETKSIEVSHIPKASSVPAENVSNPQVSVAVPSLFGGVPVSAAAVPKTRAAATTAPASSVFGRTSDNVMNIPEPTAMSANAMQPNVFGGKNNNLLSKDPAVNVTSELTGKSSQSIPVEDSLSKTPFSTTDNTVSEGSIVDAGSHPEAGDNRQSGQSLSTAEFTAPKYVFGGPATSTSQIPKLFAGDIFGGLKSQMVKQPTESTPDDINPKVSSDSGFIESGDVVSSQSSVAKTLFGGSSQEEQISDNNEVKPLELKKEHESLTEELLDKHEKVTERTSEELEREKKLNDILSINYPLDVFGKDDKSNLASQTACSPPEYDKKELTKIIVVQIPDTCLDKDIIKAHFQKFGHVKRVFLNPSSKQATVQYNDHKSASRAKRKGQKIHPNLPEVKIFYGTPARRKSEDNSNDAMVSKRKAIKTLQQSHPTGDAKFCPSDLDPYMPLERPSGVAESPIVTKHPKIEQGVRTRGTKTSKVFDDRSKSLFSDGKSNSKTVKQPVTASENKPVKQLTTLSEYRLSPRAIKKPGSPLVSRLESPKPAKLKLEENLKALSRPVSPAREYVSTDTKSIKATLELRTVNSNDRFVVLKARDKLMRNERKKRQDIEKATSLDAGCPDMCPELERHMRDVQNDLSSYEITNGVLDHKLVVKKFSRSSADKEEPLPHELRPGPVLLKTMDYLVCNIMVLYDRKDTDIGIWYNYLWDRTRAIRSDITQQQLTDGTAVTIIERCVRFHIFTAVHLCEESSDVFDRKLNTENLTKSLQTLKELYKDLAEMKKYFPTEAEFRAYEMLLNLNDGEKIVHQYSQYRDEVQKSPDVKYALKVFLALKSNNFSRFFKLIRSGTYLQGCILHRYFPQVRSKALDTFIKAYVVSKRVSIPLSYMIKTLGFENRDDAERYLNYHGIVVDNKNVVLDKNLIDLHPEGQPPVMRPVKLIESNRLFSVEEVIQAGPIPENPRNSYVPHDSFDEDGYLRQDAKDASDQQKKLQLLLAGDTATNQSIVIAPPDHLSGSVVEQPDLVSAKEHHYPANQKPPTAPEPQGLSDHDYMAFMNETYEGVTASVLSPLTREVARETIELVTLEHVEKVAIKAIGTDIISECVRKETKYIGREAYNEVDSEEKERKRREKEEAKRKRKAEEEMRHFVASSLCKEYITEILTDQLEQVCQESVDEVEKELRQKVLASLTKDLPVKLIKEVLQEEVFQLGNKVIQEMTLELEAKMEQLQQKINLRKMRDHFKKWRKVVLAARRRKEAQVTFPASFSQLSIREQNEAFSWGYNRKLSENVSAEILVKRDLEDAKRAKKFIIRDQLVRAVAWYPLPLQQEMKKIMETSSHENNLMRHYFKVLVCTSVDSNSITLQWLRSKLIGAENADVQKSLDYNFSFKSKATGLEYGCVFHEAQLQSLSMEDVRGTSAILYLINEPAASDSGYRDMCSLMESYPTIPYKVICEKASSSEELWQINEEDLLVPETSQKLMNFILELWSNHADRIQIVSCCQNNFVSGFVASHYLQPSLLKQQERRSDNKSPLSPDTYINLYNAVVQFIIGVIDDDELVRLDWPPPELSHLQQIPALTWNRTDIEKVRTSIEEMKLPGLGIEGFMNWGEICKTLHAYVGQISQPETFSIELWSHVDSLLSNTSKLLGSLYNLDFENPDTELHVLHLPWTELLYACVSYKLSCLTDIAVFYQPNRLRSFRYPKNWWEACDYSDPLWNDISYENGAVNPRKRKAEGEEEEGEVGFHREAKVPMLSSELVCDVSSHEEAKLLMHTYEQCGVGSHEEIEVSKISTELVCDIDSRQEAKVPTFSSELLCDIVREKEKYLKFQEKLECTLEEDDDYVPFWNVSERDELCTESSKIQEEDLLYEKEEAVGCSDLLSDIAKEKRKSELFQKKLESMLGDGEDLRFLFKE